MASFLLFINFINEQRQQQRQRTHFYSHFLLFFLAKQKLPPHRTRSAHVCGLALLLFCNTLQILENTKKYHKKLVSGCFFFKDCFFFPCKKTRLFCWPTVLLTASSPICPIDRCWVRPPHSPWRARGVRPIRTGLGGSIFGSLFSFSVL